jgi:carboxyl-terminal processing protease
MFRIGALGAIALLSLISSSRADQPVNRTDSEAKNLPYVVVVGVGKTADETIQPRPTAVADAKAVYDLFSDSRYLGLPKDRIVLLTDTADEARNGKVATRENILTAVKQAVAQAGKDRPIYLFLFGRGASSGDATCFFASDSNFKDRGKTGLLGTDLSAELKKVKDQPLCVVLDIHFKGFDAGKEAIVEPTLSDILKGVFGTEEKGEEAPLPHDKLVMLSAIPGYDPVAKGDHSAFTAVLLDALRGKADVEGYEPDGFVTADELVKYVEREAADAARTLGKTVKEKESIPYIVGEETSHFVMTTNPAVRPAVEARLKAYDELAKSLPAEIAAQGRTVLNRMPKLKAQQEIRKKAEQFAAGKLTDKDFLAAVADVKTNTKISTADAESFARKVLRASDALQAEYVKKLNGGELIASSVKGLFRRLELDIPADVEELVKLGKELTAGKQRELLIQVRELLGKREDLDDGKDADLAITMMIAGLNDPYTVYYDKDTIKKIESGLRGEFRGVGIQIRRDLVRDGLLVVTPIKGSPAYKAGIKAGDLITEIRREVDATGQPLKPGDPKVISTKGMKTEQALDLILGKPGVPVTLVVERENSVGPAEKITFDLKRGVVSVETVLGVTRSADDSWNYYIDEKNKVAYITLTQFSPSTHAELRKALEKLDADGCKGLVLDLRYNPGGLLMGAVLVSDLFLEDGQILEVRPRVGEPEKYYDRGFGKFTKFPMAVLINGQSASASEIVSACLQDYGRAVVVGERTYGKGSVQQVKNFQPTGGEIKLTTSRYFPPLGRNIDRLSTGGKPEEEWGVSPDKGFEYKLSREEKQELVEAFRDREIIPRRDAAAVKKDKAAVKDRTLDAAVEYLRKQIASNAGK